MPYKYRSNSSQMSPSPLEGKFRVSSGCLRDVFNMTTTKIRLRFDQYLIRIQLSFGYFSS
jgi:hypothetical protein